MYVSRFALVRQMPSWIYVALIAFIAVFKVISGC